MHVALACAIIVGPGTPINAQPKDDAAQSADPAEGNAQGWTCTFPDFARPSRLYTEHFLIAGDELLENDFFQLRFKILQNNAYGLVAVWSIAGMETNFPGKKTPTVGAMTMVINKATGDLLRSATSFDLPDDKASAVVRGTCQQSKSGR